jgi:hypothetical protein
VGSRFLASYPDGTESDFDLGGHILRPGDELPGKGGIVLDRWDVTDIPIERGELAWSASCATRNRAFQAKSGPRNPTASVRSNYETPALAGVSVSGRYWARTSDPQLVELVLSQLS